MQRVCIILTVICLLGCGCQSEKILGDHWRITFGAEDPKLTSDSAAFIGQVLAQRLHFTFLHITPENGKRWPVSNVTMSKASGIGTIGLLIIVDRRTPEIDLESRYSERRLSGNPPDEPRIEQAMAQEVLTIMKELYPHATATPYTRYAGILGP